MLAASAVLLGGLFLLLGGAYGLVRGAAALALRFGLSPLLVGLTVVAFGTSAPELVVSVSAALRGAGGIAVGNVIGSNIANVGLILAMAALIRPLTTNPALIRRDGPIMVGASALVALLLLNDWLGLLEGAVLALGLIAYVVWSVRTALQERGRGDAEPLPLPSRHAALDAGFTIAGLAVLVVGANLMVGSAVFIAETLGVSNAVIGLTVVAVGTSLPELATALVAAARGEGDLAVGNVIGSNTFNLLGILGAAAVVRPLHAPGLSPPDLVVMLAMSILGLVFLATKGRLSRGEGLVLLTVYGGYMVYLATGQI